MKDEAGIMNVEVSISITRSTAGSEEIVSMESMSMRLPGEFSSDYGYQNIINTLAEGQEYIGEMGKQCARVGVWLAAGKFHKAEKERQERIEREELAKLDESKLPHLVQSEDAPVNPS